MAVGMFSIFESMLQQRLECEDGFAEATQILKDEDEYDLREEFPDFQKAINMLKHGRGRSYDALVAKAATLPFNIRLPDQDFLNEGDASEISTIIEVDDKLIIGCAKIIQGVSAALREARSGTLI